MAPRRCARAARLCDLSGAGGFSVLKTLAQTGYAPNAMLARYVREDELFTGNAASVLL